MELGQVSSSYVILLMQQTCRSVVRGVSSDFVKGTHEDIREFIHLSL